MKLKLVFSRLNRIVVCGAVALLLLLTTAVAQTPDDEATRKLWDTGFLQKRPASAKPGPAR